MATANISFVAETAQISDRAAAPGSSGTSRMWVYESGSGTVTRTVPPASATAHAFGCAGSEHAVDRHAGAAG